MNEASSEKVFCMCEVMYVNFMTETEYFFFNWALLSHEGNMNTATLREVRR